MMDVSPRRQRRGGTTLEGNGCGPRASSCLIGEPLACGTGQDTTGARKIVIASLDPVRIPEIELAQVPVQMGGTHVLVNAVHAALQDAEVPLHRVGVDIAANVLLGAVVDAAVAAPEVPADARVDASFVGHETRVAVRVSAQD